jgi:WD40 repeat protein
MPGWILGPEETGWCLWSLGNKLISWTVGMAEGLWTGGSGMLLQGMNFTPLSTSILSELVLFLRFSFSLSWFWDSNGEQGCWHLPDILHLNLHAWAVRKVVQCCEGEYWEVFWVVTHGIQSTTHLLTGGLEKVLRIFDLNRPDAPPTLLEGSLGTPIRAALWHHGDQTILSSSNDIGGVRCGHWSIQFCFIPQSSLRCWSSSWGSNCQIYLSHEVNQFLFLGPKFFDFEEIQLPLTLLSS